MYNIFLFTRVLYNASEVKITVMTVKMLFLTIHFCSTEGMLEGCNADCHPSWFRVIKEPSTVALRTYAVNLGRGEDHNAKPCTPQRGCCIYMVNSHCPTPFPLLGLHVIHWYLGRCKIDPSPYDLTWCWVGISKVHSYTCAQRMSAQCMSAQTACSLRLVLHDCVWFFLSLRDYIHAAGLRDETVTCYTSIRVHGQGLYKQNQMVGSKNRCWE